jgi:tetrapyrrole methylase family protein/MazG family protein/ATP diphosphatase
MTEYRSPADTMAAFDRLMELIRILRSENGCPWDKEQTPQTIHPYILEEYHEMVEAMGKGISREITDELGDLIFLTVFIAYIFEQQGATSLVQVLDGVVEKMRRRHPHVFGDVQVKDADDVIDNWGKIKASEENIRARTSILDGIPRSLPALNRAQKLARRASKVGFDWSTAQDVFGKVEEEFGEFKQAVASGSQADMREELGDLLFVVVNAARHLQINSEAALNETSDKFERRFRHIEQRLREQGKTVAESDLPEMDALWDEAKELEKRNANG